MHVGVIVHSPFGRSYLLRTGLFLMVRFLLGSEHGIGEAV